jgi:hypothetical protein
MAVIADLRVHTIQTAIPHLSVVAVAVGYVAVAVAVGY